MVAQKIFQSPNPILGVWYYDSELSNWLSVDPMADDYPGLSPYAYVANNPVGFVDPNGEDIVPTNKAGRKATWNLIQKYNKDNVFDLKTFPMKKGGETYYQFGTKYTNNPYSSKSQFKRAMKIKGDDLDEAWGLFNALVSKKNYEVEAWKPNENTTYGKTIEGTRNVNNVEGFPLSQTENANFENAFSQEATPGNIENLFQQNEGDTRAEKSGEGFLYYQNKTQNPRKAGTEGIIILDARKNTTKSLGNALRNIFE